MADPLPDVAAAAEWKSCPCCRSVSTFFELIGRKLAKRGLTVLLTDKIADGLTIISDAKQLC
ncbi:Uncharacterised protein [Salmonella sp. NCTC 11881]|nr:Uncharacterised protein [Salmonella sp. NCTC 11881]